MYTYNYLKADLSIVAVVIVVSSFLPSWILKAITSGMWVILS